MVIDFPLSFVIVRFCVLIVPRFFPRTRGVLASSVAATYRQTGAAPRFRPYFVARLPVMKSIHRNAARSVLKLATFAPSR